MREIVSIATLFLMLAAAGMEAEPAKTFKTCHAGPVGTFFSIGC